ncbi:hypothetical protein RP20_CCG008043 [Aedes albopictus]|nr:hypothetical protein RP20_CCG008043 [Aedes albopictus]
MALTHLAPRPILPRPTLHLPKWYKTLFVIRVQYVHSSQPQSDKTLVQPKLAGGGPISGKGGAAGKPVYMTQLANKSVVMNPANDSQGTSQLSGDPKGNVIVVNQTTISPQPLGTVVQAPQPPQQATGTTTIMNQSGTISSTTTNPSALIKSLLANKVTTVTSNDSAATSSTGGIVVSSTSSTATSSLSSTTTINTSINPSTPATSQCLIASNVNVHQVAQRQQMLKQKQMKSPSPVASPPPNSSVVVTSNNPNNLTNIKVGNSTISIKPGTLPTNTVITTTNPHEMNPPPLAPLSQNPNAMMKPLAGNKMLADLLDKKTNDPPVFAIGETTVKRKSDVDATEPPAKKLDFSETEEIKVTPKAADLYAELAGSILEDEDMEDIEIKPKEEPKINVQPAPAQQVITMPMQRQIIVAPNNPQSMMLSPGSSGQHLTAQTTATIKTDSGYQTVPILLQHNQNQIQIQKTAPVMTPTVISNPQQTTQYILATNQQGQTYVVAQQPQPQPQMQQTVLLTQNPQTGAQQKTIIILQQQPTQQAGSQQIQTQQISAQPQQHAPQKVFVNQQGQQIIMTQVPRQVQHQGNTITIDGSSQQIIKTSQQPTQIIQQQAHPQIQQIIQPGGGQTFQIIQQPAQQTTTQPTQQIVIQSQPPQPQQQQIVIQQQPSQQMQPQIISQQIIQPATQQQPQVVQKIIQQKLVHAPSQQQQQPQKITVQKQPVSHSPGTITVTKQTATTSSPQVGQLPTKTIIVQQQPATAGGTPQKQIIQVLQQKISSPAASQSPVLQKTQIVHAPGTHPGKQTVAQSQSSVGSHTTSVTSKTATQTSDSSKFATKPIVAPSTEASTVSSRPSTPAPVIQAKPAAMTTATPTATSSATPTTSTAGQPTASVPVAGSNSTIQMIPAMDPSKAIDEDVDPSWPWVCDWRGCPRKKYASANEVYIHACAVHCPDTIDSAADIYCQWGPGPNLCDNLPRKRFSLMTHIFDRHCTSDIVIQQQPSQQMQPQIISQQIIQPATQQQPQVVQKIIQQKLVHAPSQQQQQPQKITVQKQPVSHSPGTITVTKQTATTSSPQVGQLPTKTIIVQQQPATAGGTPQKQIIQVLQQKISSPAASQSPVLQKTQIVHAPGTHPGKQTVAQSQSSVGSHTTSVTSKTATQTSDSSKFATKPIVAPSTEASTVSSRPSTPAPVIQAKPAAMTTATPTATSSATPTTSTAGQPTASVPVAGSNSTIQMIPAMDPSKAIDEDVDPSWPWVCDWRGCPRKKYASANEVYIHACAVHCPDTIDSAADIYCQWGPGPNLCDNLPRKRFSLMTHIFDRHCTSDAFKQAVQRRLSNTSTSTTQQAYPVTLVRQPTTTSSSNNSNSSAPGSSASSTTSESSASSSPALPAAPQPQGPGVLSSAGPAALHAIKRHAIDWINAKEFQDDIEGPVTKSIRLTSALILRNLVVYSNSARRALRAYEPHLAGVAMNNVESSRTISQVLFEMNDAQPNY